MAKQKINKAQTKEAWFNGDIGVETAIGYKTLGHTFWDTEGITRTDATTLTVVTKGRYYISYQQLVNPTAAQGYFSCRKNNANVVYGYYMASRMADYGSSCLIELNVGDTIRIHQDVAITTSWSAGHSTFQMFLVREL